MFRLTRFRKNQILFFEGALAQHLFGLRSGLVKTVKTLANGKERITRVLFPGALFGFEALSESTYPLTAVVLCDSVICSVTRAEFLEFLRTNSEAAVGMISFLVDEVQRARSQMTDMSFKDARMRVATFVLSLIPSDPVRSAGACSLTLPLSSHEVSEVLELSPETVSRTWSALRREGLIEKRGRQLIVQDRQALEEIAQG